MENTTRTFEELMGLTAEGYVYIFCADKETEDRFMRDAENACILTGNGDKPTARGGRELVTLNADRTISFPGTNGHIAFQSAKKMGDKTIIRVDYRKFVGGGDYLI